MPKISTNDLIGPALDWAVIVAGEEWKTAHQHFPTLTMDPTFKGVSFEAYGGFVYLLPSNPIRQDLQPFSPSTVWNYGGPIIQRENIMVDPPTSRVHRHGGPNAGWGQSGVWGATMWQNGVSGSRPVSWHETSALIAAMRCFVEFKLGEEVEIPDVLAASLAKAS